MSDLKSAILALLKSEGPTHVWVPTDFTAFGSRDAVDKALQRLVRHGELRRIDRGLYSRSSATSSGVNSESADYRAVVDAIARRDQLRLLVDGQTAANDLGLADAAPPRITLHTDARRRSIELDNFIIEFKPTAPSRLYWAGRPAMRVVQALHWLKDSIVEDPAPVFSALVPLLATSNPGTLIRRDLLEGFNTLPTWMQSFVRDLPGCDPATATGGPLKQAKARVAPKRSSSKGSMGVSI